MRDYSPEQLKNKTNNLRRTPEYRAWDNMKSRCMPTYTRSENYMGRGIKVCDEWRDNFNSFYEHVGKRPSPEYSLDRKNNDGNYEPGNVRWATRSQQQFNKRITNKYGCSGISKLKTKRFERWGAVIKINKKVIYLGSFNSLGGAISARKRAEEKYA